MQATTALVFLMLPLSAAAAVAPGHDGVTRLYGKVAEVTGGFRFDKGPNWLVTGAEGGASWTVEAPEAGDYAVNICYAAGSQVRLSVTAEGSLTHDVPPTKGVFSDPYINFQRFRLPGTLKLAAGSNIVQLHVSSPEKFQLRFRSLELMPTTRRPPSKTLQHTGTSWFARAGYGLMFHWTSESQPKSGSQKSYSEAVAAFDVPAFAEMVEETGATYVLFTANHAKPHCPAPIAAWEKAHPGSTTKRDLIGELASELSRRKIRLMLYFASHTLGGLDKSTQEQYLSIHESVLQEIGRRYGARISGYWFDGWYQTLERFPRMPMDEMADIVKTGNPDRLIAYNFWVYPVETQHQDYWAAEVGGIVKPPASRILSDGPGKGLQSHYLIMADAPWVHSKAGPMEAPRFSDSDLINFVRLCAAKQTPVTINLGIYQEGMIGNAAMNQMKALRLAIRGK